MVSVAKEDALYVPPRSPRVQGKAKLRSHSLPKSENKSKLRKAEKVSHTKDTGISGSMLQQYHHRSHSFPLYSCGDDNFWATCWEDDSRCSVSQDNDPSSPYRCIDMRIADGRLNPTKHVDSPKVVSDDESRLSSPLNTHTSQPFQKRARKANGDRTARNVRFTRTIHYKDSDDPLTEEERARYFWSESESRSCKVERRALLTKYKSHLHSYGSAFWNENEDSM